MEVQDATGAPLGRVEDVYVERERPATRYVALAGDESGHHRLVPIECVRMDRDGVVVALTSEHLGGAPTVARDATVTREHEGPVATYYRDLHEAGYMRPWVEPPELHGAGYMRPEQEPPEVGGAGANGSALPERRQALEGVAEVQQDSVEAGSRAPASSAASEARQPGAGVGASAPEPTDIKSVRVRAGGRERAARRAPATPGFSTL